MYCLVRIGYSSAGRMQLLLIFDLIGVYDISSNNLASSWYFSIQPAVEQRLRSAAAFRRSEPSAAQGVQNI